MRQLEEYKKSVLTQILTPEARERRSCRAYLVNKIKLVKADKVAMIENSLIQVGLRLNLERSERQAAKQGHGAAAHRDAGELQRPEGGAEDYGTAVTDAVQEARAGR